MPCRANKVRLLDAFIEHLLPQVFRYGELTIAEVKYILGNFPKRSQKSYVRSYCSLADSTGFCIYDHSRGIIVANPASESTYSSLGTSSEVLNQVLARFSYFVRYLELISTVGKVQKSDLLHPDEVGIGTREDRIKSLSDWYEWLNNKNHLDSINVDRDRRWIASSHLYQDKGSHTRDLGLALLLMAAGREGHAVSKQSAGVLLDTTPATIETTLYGFEAVGVPLANTDEFVWLESPIELHQSGQDDINAVARTLTGYDTQMGSLPKISEIVQSNHQDLFKNLPATPSTDSILNIPPLQIPPSTHHDYEAEEESIREVADTLKNIQHENKFYCLPLPSDYSSISDLVFSIPTEIEEDDPFGESKGLYLSPLYCRDRYCHLGSFPIVLSGGIKSPIGLSLDTKAISDQRKLLQVCQFIENIVLRYIILTDEWVSSIKRVNGDWIVTHGSGQTRLSELVGVLLERHDQTIVGMNDFNEIINGTILLGRSLSMLTLDRDTQELTVDEEFLRAMRRGELGISDFWMTVQTDIQQPLNEHVTQS